VLLNSEHGYDPHQLEQISREKIQRPFHQFLINSVLFSSHHFEYAKGLPKSVMLKQHHLLKGRFTLVDIKMYEKDNLGTDVDTDWEEVSEDQGTDKGRVVKVEDV
jgi:hypothetical protein